ncbi:hypothetical protein GOODEAATRI_021179, partial [Goodea atripinnis]
LSADEDAVLGDSYSDKDEEEDEADEEESDAVSGSDDEESSLDSGDDSDSGPDLARGKGNIETSSDEDDDDDVDDILKKEEEEIEHDWGELCKDALRNDEVSARLAVCNMDWDRLKAKDLLALFNSFVPKGGAIFPSEFGKERLNVEETQGPPELKALPDDSDDDTEEEREKLRAYQFKRLKYFYAVVECDSVETAAKVYDECDGYEYESSCSVLDLRFIPEDVTFEEEPKDVATDINLLAYTPKLFTSSAATSKVQLTWDETDHERVTALNKKFNKEELLDLDFKAYLASSRDAVRSEEQINKYRELLRSIQVKEKKLQEDKDMEMEITWVPGPILISNMCKVAASSWWISGLQNQAMDRWITRWSLCLQVDVSDPRFQAMFTSHLFNLDPSHPSFRKTRATQSILEEKQRRREEGLSAQKATPTPEEETGPGAKQEAAGTKQEKDTVVEKKTMDPSLSLLVKSIKSKTEQFQARKKRKVT